MNEMPTFDVTSIPTQFSPLMTLDGRGEHDTTGDEKLHVTFTTQAVLNPHKSTVAGRPVYDDIDMIIVRTPGSQLTSIVEHAKRYTPGRPILAAKYQAWKAGQLESAGGTPLENFPFMFTKPSLIAELKYRNIFTVEQLADLPDSGKQSIMGGHELCRLATEWIAKSKGDAVDAEKEELKARLAAMESQLAALAAPKGRSKAQEKADTAPQLPEFIQSSEV